MANFVLHDQWQKLVILRSLGLFIGLKYLDCAYGLRIFMKHKDTNLVVGAFRLSVKSCLSLVTLLKLESIALGCTREGYFEQSCFRVVGSNRR